MAMDDLTDALRAIIEPMRGTLISAAQGHYLASIREEVADMVRHGERALELIGTLIPEDTEPHWPQEALQETHPLGPPPDEGTVVHGSSITGPTPEQPKTITRDTPQPGEVWLFTGERRFSNEVIAEIQEALPDNHVDLAQVIRGEYYGEFFRFNASYNPRPVKLLKRKG